MENISQLNIRILIGQELGEIYLIIQQYINNKWQHNPNHKYRGQYFVNKKVKELLKYNIKSVRKGSKNDLVKFKIADNIQVYINDYSMIKDYPELKNLSRVLRKKIVCQKISNNMILLKKQHQQLSKNNIVKFVATSALSLGLIGTTTFFKMEDEKNKINIQLDNVSNNSGDNITNLSEELVKNQKIQTINNLTNKVISEHKINNNFIIELPTSENKNVTEESIIKKYADMYFMDYNKASKIYFDNYEEIMASDNVELTFLLKIKDEFYADESIDKKTIITDMTPEEKEEYIIHFAKDVYKIEDEETYALLLAIHRLEAYNGISRRCIEDNNPGGLKEGGVFLEFKTFEIGAECFVRNVQNIMNQTKNMSNYNYDLSFEDNMQTIYCEGDNTWGVEVKNIKDSILENNELDVFLEKDNINDKKYLKVK